MGDLIYLFDLDSTVTKQEILPTIAKKIGIYDEMRSITESTMRGELPFKQSFLKRVGLLKNIHVQDVADMIAEIPCENGIVQFMREHMESCFVVTGNLDVWIDGLMKKIGMDGHVFCSKAIVDDEGFISKVLSVVDKGAVIKQMVTPFVAVGDGNNDAEMIEAAVVGIGYGAVRDVSDAVLASASHVVYSEECLIRLLNKTLEVV